MENDLKDKFVPLSKVLVNDIDKIKNRIDMLFNFVNNSRKANFEDFETKHAIIDKICAELSNINYNDLSNLKTEINMTR